MEVLNRKSIHSNRRCKTFTLVELLVTIAIIAILAGLLLPALKAARGKVYSIDCLSREKQMGVAVHAYANDNDDFMPAKRSWNFNSDDNAGGQIISKCWTATLSEYLADKKAKGSYAAPGKNNFWMCLAQLTLDTALTCLTNYTYAQGFSMESGEYNFPRKLMRFTRPSVTIVLGDYGQPGELNRNGAVFTTIDTSCQTNLKNSGAYYRHNNHGNFMLVDGHAAGIDGIQVTLKVYYTDINETYHK